MRNNAVKLVLSSALFLAAFYPVTGTAGELLGLAPSGANDFHITLLNPIVPGGGIYESIPFSHPNYDPNGPPSTSLDYSGAAVVAGTKFSLNNWNLVTSDVAPPPGSLVVLKTWWTIGGVKQDEGSMNYTGMGSLVTRLQPVPEPASYILFCAGLIGIAIMARRKGALVSDV